MTDAEIIKALECCADNQHCWLCVLRDKEDDCHKLEKLALDLINRQQEELESIRLSLGLINKRKYYRKFVDEVFRKQKGKELSTPDFDYIYELYFKQQAEVERLTKETMNMAITIETCQAEAIKEFAERFISLIHTHQYILCDKHNSKDYGMFTNGIEQAVNETKKEMVGEE